MNKKIKILWFCGVHFTEQKTRETGTWLNSMSKGLIESGEIELFNITHAKVSKIITDQNTSINQWILPKQKLNRNGLPSKKIIQKIQSIVSQIQPDIIHVWGTEAYWGLLTARNFIQGTTLLEIQGLKFEISKYFYSGLSNMDLCSSINIKELLKPSASIFSLKKAFSSWGKFEKEMIENHNHINTQSEWVRAIVERLNKNAKKYNAIMSLRHEFNIAEKWNIEKCIRHRLFTLTSEVISYKGLHVLIDAIALLKKDFPDIQLNIASGLTKGIRRDGYTRFLFNKIKKKGLTEHVNWLGPLTAPDIVKELQAANATVIPSFIESYCMALEESTFVGTPTVASFAGAMPELGKHRETVCYFQSGDANMCAYEVKRIFENDEAAAILSNNAYNSKQDRFNRRAIKEQISTYKEMLQQSKDRNHSK